MVKDFAKSSPQFASRGFGVTVNAERWNGRHAMFGMVAMVATAYLQGHGLIPDADKVLDIKQWGGLAQVGFGETITNERAIVMIAHVHGTLPPSPEPYPQNPTLHTRLAVHTASHHPTHQATHHNPTTLHTNTPSHNPTRHQARTSCLARLPSPEPYPRHQARTFLAGTLVPTALSLGQETPRV